MPREPWIKLKIGFRRSGKIAALPGDSARLGWTYALLEAKTQRRMGVFDSRAHFTEVLGRFGRFFDSYVAQDLLEVAPDLCRECKPRHKGIRKGEVVIHDYLKEQRDPTNADRQAIYRETHGGPDEEPDSDADVTQTVTAPITPTVTEEPPPTVTPDSRARATTATGTVTTLSTGRDSSSSIPGAPVKRDDVAALLERGWPKVTRAQRRVLDEVLARHDVTGPAFAAEAIRMTPADADPLAAVMDADRRWQVSQRAQADAAEQEWSATKEPRRNGSSKGVELIGELLEGGPTWMQPKVEAEP